MGLLGKDRSFTEYGHFYINDRLNTDFRSLIFLSIAVQGSYLGK